MGTRTGTFCKEDDDAAEVAAFLMLFRMLVTDWPGSQISGISYKSGRCDGCVMFQLGRSVLFLRLVGRLPLVISESWLDCTQYVSNNDLCIDHLQSTGAEVIVEEMDAFEEDGAWLMSDDADTTFQKLFIGADRLIRVLCSCRHA